MATTFWFLMHCQVSAQQIRQQAYLKASNTASAREFGISTAISDDTVVVGALREPSPSSYEGAVYVFVRSGTNWSHPVRLKASNPDNMDLFGSSVAMFGDTIVVGAPGESSDATGVNGDQSDNNSLESGAAYVFVRAGTTWRQQAYLKASINKMRDHFGQRVVISGERIAISGGAAVYVFHRDGTNWSQQTILKPSDALDTTFGSSLAMFGDTLAVGSLQMVQRGGVTIQGGAVYVFVREGNRWNEQALLYASNSEANDWFSTVALWGDTLVVGAEKEDSSAQGVNGNQADNSAPDSGAAYVFVRNGTNWTQQAYLKASNAEAEDWFGAWTVAVSGDTAVVAAELEDSNATGINGNQNDNSATSAGAAYVFVRSGTNWTQQAYIKASNTHHHNMFGWHFALSDGTLVVGAPGEFSSAIGVNGNQTQMGDSQYGAAYIFTHVGVPESRLAIQKAPSEKIALAWNTGPEVRLQKSTRLNNPLWETVPFTSGNAIDFTATDPAAFFRLLKLFPLEIERHPENQRVPVGSNVTFTVSALGTGDLLYQWLRNNIEIPSANGAVFPLTNVQIADEGVYRARVSDEENTLLSSEAALSVLMRPVITEQPQSQTVNAGDTVTLRISVEGHPPPFGYRWRRNGVLLTNMISSEKTSTYTIADVQTNHTGNYDCIVTNAAFYQPGIRSSIAVLTVLQP